LTSSEVNKSGGGIDAFIGDNVSDILRIIPPLVSAHTVLFFVITILVTVWKKLLFLLTLPIIYWPFL
jgi:hypothetical protein